MNTQFEVRCDCCGLLARLADGDDCSRCGYPLKPEKEERFLADNIRNLQRVATHGGASLPVSALISRYRRRLNYLSASRVQTTTVPVTPSIPVQQPGSTISASGLGGDSRAKSVNTVENPITPFPVAAEKISAQVPVFQAPVQPSLPISAEIEIPPVVPQKATRTFSLKAFFADQTINIVSSLGAFLILIGSLSFVVTTPNLGLAFFTLLLVHALFGSMGAVTRRFKSFRIVSVIYTAIFALQVPLVGLAGYRLVSGTAIQFSPSGIVAIAALYAAIVYGALAIYQRFQPFAYLAAASITVVDIALAITFHLDYWWWPSPLMLLALASLFCISPSTIKTSAVQKPWEILFQPMLVLMMGYVGLGYLSVFLSWTFLLIVDPFAGSRFSIACTLLLLFCWTCLFAWRSRLGKVLLQLPYVFLACVLAFAYACSSSSSGYVIILTAMALFYHCIDRLAQKNIQRVQKLREHIEFLVLAFVCVIPLIADAALPFRVFAKAYGLGSFRVVFSSDVIIAIVALLCCVVITGSVILGHTGWQKTPAQVARKWCWLLLLSGLLFDWVYSLMMLALNVDPVWSTLVLTCILLLITIYARRSTSAVWADPLDILTLAFATQTLLLAIPQGRVVLLSLLLAFAGVSYGVALYQRRLSLLLLPIAFALLAASPLSGSPAILFLLCMLLPLVWAILDRLLHSYGNNHVLVGSLWTVPVLLIGGLYTLEFLSVEGYNQITMLGLWLQRSLPIALELALLACIWYSAAVIARRKIGLIAALVLACWALLFPTSTSLVLACVAFGCILLAAAISRFAGRDWGVPLYIVGLLAALMLASSGQSPKMLVFTSWALLSFGILLYLVGIVERASLLAAGLRWLAVVFVIWSLYDAGLLSEYAWAPLMAMLGAAMGLGIRMIVPLMAPMSSSKNTLWSYAGPFYTISLASAILMGLDGVLLGIAQPFYGAIPDALLAYAVVVYGVLLLEKYPQGLFLTAGFALWGLILMAQMPVIHCAAVGIALGLVGICCGRVIKFDSRQAVTSGSLINIQWNWPWYLTFLVAGLLTGSWNLLALNKVDVVFLENGLLAFAILAYVIVLVEEMPLWLGWISVGFASWSLIGADQTRLFCIVLFCTFAGVLTRLIERIVSSPYQQWWQHRRFNFACLLYSTALVAAVLSGFLHTNVPFYAAVPFMLMLYGLLAYGVALLERRSWFWFCAGFIIWGVCLLPQSAGCQIQPFIQIVPTCHDQSWTIPLTNALLVGVTLVSGILGLCIGRLTGSSHVSVQGLSLTNIVHTRFRWNWPWYLISLVSLMVTLAWCASVSSSFPVHTLTVVLALFLGFVLVLMVAERLPDLSLLAIGLAVWLITQTEWAAWQMVCAYSLLCLFVFAGQLLWKRIPPVLEVVSATGFARVVSLSGLGIVILTVVAHGGLSSQVGQGQAQILLAQSGVFTLCISAILLYWLARLLSSPENKMVRYACYYGAGLLLSLTIPWELLAFGQTDVALLTLVPASYMIITSPFLLHDEQWVHLRWVGQGIALCGAMLLLLPTLWSSFDHQQVFPVLLLSAESLCLFLLGASVRVRFFVLSGAALVVVSAIHLLFLPELGIPPFLALTLSGVVLLALATGLLVIRTRVAAVWSELD